MSGWLIRLGSSDAPWVMLSSIDSDTTNRPFLAFFKANRSNEGPTFLMGEAFNSSPGLTYLRDKT